MHGLCQLKYVTFNDKCATPMTTQEDVSFARQKVTQNLKLNDNTLAL